MRSDLRLTELFGIFQARTPIYVRRFLFNLLVAGTLLSSVEAMADNPRHKTEFVSENGRYVLFNVHYSVERTPIFDNGEYVGVMKSVRDEPVWGLFDAHAAQPVDPANGLLTLMAGRAPSYVLTGDLSSRTALISDDGMNIVVIDDFSERSAVPDLEVLHFYNSGMLVATYRLRELLENVENVRHTSSHFRWLFWESLSLDRETLSLTTTECVPLMFSVSTGAMITAFRRAPAGSFHSESECPVMQ